MQRDPKKIAEEILQFQLGSEDLNAQLNIHAGANIDTTLKDTRLVSMGQGFKGTANSLLTALYNVAEERPLTGDDIETLQYAHTYLSHYAAYIELGSSNAFPREYHFHKRIKAMSWGDAIREQNDHGDEIADVRYQAVEVQEKLVPLFRELANSLGLDFKPNEFALATVRER